MQWRETTGFVVLSVLLGSLWIPERVLGGSMSAGYVAALAYTLGAAVAILLCLLTRVRLPQWDEWRPLCIVCGTFVAALCVLYVAEMMPFHLSAQEIITLHASAPLAVAVLTPLWLERKVPRSAMLMMAVGLGGIWLMLSATAHLTWMEAFDIVFGFISIACTAGAFLYAKRTLQHVEPMFSAAIIMLGLTIAAWPLALATGGESQIAWSGTIVTAVVLVGLGSAMAAALGFWLLQRTEPYQLVMVRIAAPVVMFAEAWLILRSRPGWQMALGAVLAVASVVAVVLSSENEDEPIGIFPAEDAQPPELH